MKFIHPFADQEKFPGMRLVIDHQEDDDFLELREEKTLPERVQNPEAQRVLVGERITLSPADAMWLRDVLNRMYPPEPAADEREHHAIGAVICVTIVVDGNLRAAYDAVHQALSTDALPDEPREDVPFVLRLLDVAVALPSGLVLTSPRR